MDASLNAVDEVESGVVRFVRRLVIWTLVCGVCAAPTSFIAWQRGFDVQAILLVDLLVIVGYTFISRTERFERWLVDPVTRRTMWVGFGTRMLFSIPIPPLQFVDMAIGMISVFAVAGRVPRGTVGFGTTFMISMIDALLMNAVLWVFMGIVYLIVYRVTEPKPIDGFCLKCGYDLRGSPTKCPECGEIVRNDPLVRRLNRA